MKIPTEMKAIVCNGFGSPGDKLEHRTVPVPRLNKKKTKKKNQVLIRVHAASINGGDVRLCRGSPFLIRLMMGGCFAPPKNTILGSDIAGTIVACDSDVSKWKIGDEVLTDLSYQMKISGFAEYALAEEDMLVRKPSSISFEQAAGVPIAANTAWDALKFFGDEIQKDEEILINGASGNVGLFVIQLAKLWGGKVTAVCSGNKEDLVRDAGADYIIDRKKINFTVIKNQQHQKYYDLIVDCYATRKWTEIQKVLTPDTGRYVLVGGPSFGTMLKFMMKRDPRIGVVTSSANVSQIQQLMKLMEDGKLRTFIDQIMPLSKGPQAVERLEVGDVGGKLILSIYNTDGGGGNDDDASSLYSS